MSTKEHAARAARLKVSGNRNRFFDALNGFDLDLTYIMPRIIAMSVPSSGSTALYRNPIGEVVRFFNTRHRRKFRIYNLCPELPYAASLFDHNVVTFDVEDHTPPRFAYPITNARRLLTTINLTPVAPVVVHIHTHLSIDSSVVLTHIHGRV